MLCTKYRANVQAKDAVHADSPTTYFTSSFSFAIFSNAFMLSPTVLHTVDFVSHRDVPKFISMHERGICQTFWGNISMLVPLNIALFSFLWYFLFLTHMSCNIIFQYSRLFFLYICLFQRVNLCLQDNNLNCNCLYYQQ